MISFAPPGLLLLALSALISVDAYNINIPAVAESRRSFLGNALVGAVATCSLIPAQSALAEPDPSIQRFPPVQYLFPVYNFQDLLDFISERLNANTEEGIRQASERVDEFLKGGFISNKSLFKSLCTIYIGEIKYSPGAERQAIQAAFLGDCDQIVEAIVNLQKPLQSLVKEGATEPTQEVLGYLKDSQTGLLQFLNRIPQEDVVKLRAVIEKFKDADANQNKKLDREEVSSFSDEELEIYKTVGDLIFQAK